MRGRGQQQPVRSSVCGRVSGRRGGWVSCRVPHRLDGARQARPAGRCGGSVGRLRVSRRCRRKLVLGRELAAFCAARRAEERVRLVQRSPRLLPDLLARRALSCRRTRPRDGSRRPGVRPARVRGSSRLLLLGRGRDHRGRHGSLRRGGDLCRLFGRVLLVPGGCIDGLEVVATRGAAVVSPQSSAGAANSAATSPG